ncbi:MAG: hypothetical protein HC888_00475 [Candidatus Competibacteraceae bacterium]|nr:hypothetical protein [Candidatus Competibacteraceae bacterium]
MAGIGFSVQSGQVNTSNGTWKTVLQVIAPTNQRLIVNRVKVAFEGITANEAPIQVEIVKQSTAGAGGSSATAYKKVSTDDETLQTTALSGMTTEPTTADVYDQTLIHPQTGHTFMGPFVVPGGTRLGVRVSATTAVDCTVAIQGEE